MGWSVTLRVEDGPLLRGEGRYLDDLLALSERDRVLRAVFVRSPYPHARIKHVDFGGAVGFAADDLSLGPMRGHQRLAPRFDRPPLARDVARFVGDPVAVVVAPTRAEAVDAAEAVVVDYEPLPLVSGEVAFELRTADDHILDGADIVIRGRFVNQRVASSPMEPDGAYAEPDGEGVLLWASTQRVHAVRDAVAASLGIDHSLVRVRAPQVGGGFGGKFEPAPEAVVVAALARTLRRPVGWTQTRTENLMCMPHGRGQVQHAALAVRRDGTMVAIHADVVGDAGAYPGVGAVIPNATLLMLAGAYRFERAGGRGRSLVTNTTPVGAYRGAGRPEAAALVERIVDMAAVELGMDPVDLRRQNLVETFPHASPTGMTYDSGDYRACLDGAVHAIGYDAVRREQAARRAAGSPVLLGVGVAMWLDCTPMNRPGEWASVDLVVGGDDVRLVIRDGANDQGQAHATTWGLLLSERLGLPVECVHLEHGDTGFVPTGEGTGSARSTMLAGGSVAACGDDLLAQARERAAELLEADPRDIVVLDGRLSVAGSPAQSVSWAEIGDLRAEFDYMQSGPTFPSGCHAAVVEVDAETGKVGLVRFVAVDECGTVVNPVVVAGQQHGGIVQGIAQALWEEVVFDDAGNPLTTTFVDYGIPSAADLPSLDVRTVDVTSPVNVLGAKGIGQAGAIGSTIAVQNAVVDALGHLGVRHIDLPLTPERVHLAMMR